MDGCRVRARVVDSCVIFAHGTDELGPVPLVEEPTVPAFWEAWLDDAPEGKARVEILRRLLASIAATGGLETLPECLAHPGSRDEARCLFRWLRAIAPLVFERSTPVKAASSVADTLARLQYRLLLCQVRYAAEAEDAHDLLVWVTGNWDRLAELRGEAIEGDLTEVLWGGTTQNTPGARVAKIDGEWPASYIEWLTSRGRPFRAVRPWRVMRSLNKVRSHLHEEAGQKEKAGDPWEAKEARLRADELVAPGKSAYRSVLSLILRGLLLGSVAAVLFRLRRAGAWRGIAGSMGLSGDWSQVVFFPAAGILMSVASCGIPQHRYLRVLIWVCSMGGLASFVTALQRFSGDLTVASVVIATVLVWWVVMYHRPRRSYEPATFWARRERAASALLLGGAVSLLPALCFAWVVQLVGKWPTDSDLPALALLWLGVQAALHGAMADAVTPAVPLPRLPSGRQGSPTT